MSAKSNPTPDKPLTFQQEADMKLAELKTFGSTYEYDEDRLALGVTSVVHLASKRLQQGVINLDEVYETRIRAASIAGKIAEQFGDMNASVKYNLCADAFKQAREYIIV